MPWTRKSAQVKAGKIDFKQFPLKPYKRQGGMDSTENGVLISELKPGSFKCKWVEKWMTATNQVEEYEACGIAEVDDPIQITFKLHYHNAASNEPGHLIYSHASQV